VRESRAACKGRDLRQPSRRRVRACLGCHRARPRPEHRHHGAHCAACSRAASLVSLSSLSLLSSTETELPVLLARRASSSAAVAHAASAAAAASTSALVVDSSVIVSLAAVAAVSAALARVPLPRQSRPSAGAARSRRPSTETVIRTWCTSGGLLRGEEAVSDELLLVCAGEDG
jgi:hypothetical protein